MVCNKDMSQKTPEPARCLYSFKRFLANLYSKSRKTGKKRGGNAGKVLKNGEKTGGNAGIIS
ncbi:hypothetical protein DVB69_01225 [Sporosarcina sp. BI001-red]|nr:hypothetical protein DVB69_01335 [Sporosarcina sp. BI001-red]REB11146.1 hypothetical protein DVB69_01225 [Sporosarcina sp. BI001-red]